MFASDVAATLGAFSGALAVILSVATWWAARRAKRAQNDVDYVRAAHETLVGTIHQMEAAMHRQDVEHAAEIAQLRGEVATIKAHHEECERRRAELTRRVAELEAR